MEPIAVFVLYFTYIYVYKLCFSPFEMQNTILNILCYNKNFKQRILEVFMGNLDEIMENNRK